MTALQQQLFDLQDLKYRDFHAKLLPGIDKETIIGFERPFYANLQKILPHRKSPHSFFMSFRIIITKKTISI